MKLYRQSALSLLLVILAAACGSSSSPPSRSASGRVAGPAPRYRLLQRIPIGEEGGWDYLSLDPEARRLYISRATRVLVLDVDTGARAGGIKGTQGVHGIALAPDLHRGFTSNGRTSTVTIFDTQSLAVVAEVPVTGENPDAILYDRASRRVFTFNGRGKNATALDAATGAVAGTIGLDGKPESAAADGSGRVFVNIEDRNEVAALDTRTLQVEARWGLAPCEEPTGMAIDAAHRRLFIGCHNRTMVVVDTETGRVVASLPIGAGVDADAFDPATSLAFASNGEGTLTVVREESPDSFRVADNVVTQRGARTMALDEKTHRIFLATAQFAATPTPTPGGPSPRPAIVPGTFTILVFGP